MIRILTGGAPGPAQESHAGTEPTRVDSRQKLQQSPLRRRGLQRGYDKEKLRQPRARPTTAVPPISNADLRS